MLNLNPLENTIIPGHDNLEHLKRIITYMSEQDPDDQWHVQLPIPDQGASPAQTVHDKKEVH